MRLTSSAKPWSRFRYNSAAALLLISSVASLSIRQAYAGNPPAKSAPAPKSAAPAKAASPAAKSGSSTGATSHSAGGSASGSKAGGAAASGSKAGGSASGGKATGAGASKPAVGSVKSNANGTKTVQTSKGEVTKSASGKPVAFKGNNGHEAKFASNGKVKEVHAEAKGGGKLTVTHAGNVRRTVIERPDHSRLVSEGHGRGYIEHRYTYGGHAYYARGYYYNGGYYRTYYHPYYYGGVQLYGYVPAYYYPTAYYGWAYNPWPAPAPYAWGWGAAPWYGYYGAYFAPYPVYPSPAYWLTDYMIAATLSAAFQAAAENAGLHFPDEMPDLLPDGTKAPHIKLASFSLGRNYAVAAAAAASANVAMTPEVKKAVSDEIQLDLAAQKAAPAGADGPSVGSLGTLLADGKPHVFVAGASVSATSAGEDCSITDGDVLSLNSAPAKDAENANLSVLASKQSDCAKGSTVSVALTDVQEMHNHLLASIDKGLGEMKDNPGKGGIPAPPATATAGAKEAPYAAAAPAADADGAAELASAAKEGGDTENQVVAEANAADGTGGATADTESAGTAPGNAVASSAPQRPAPMVTITQGQTPDQIIAMKGQPSKILNFGAKQIYVYPDMKITFTKGKLTDAE